MLPSEVLAHLRQNTYMADIIERSTVFHPRCPGHPLFCVQLRDGALPKPTRDGDPCLPREFLGLPRKFILNSVG